MSLKDQDLSKDLGDCKGAMSVSNRQQPFAPFQTYFPTFHLVSIGPTIKLPQSLIDHMIPASLFTCLAFLDVLRKGPIPLQHWLPMSSWQAELGPETKGPCQGGERERAPQRLGMVHGSKGSMG